ncbi:hypothetical protein JCM16814_23120 [Desulfobaculum senezii]
MPPARAGARRMQTWCGQRAEQGGGGRHGLVLRVRYGAQFTAGAVKDHGRLWRVLQALCLAGSHDGHPFGIGFSA